MQRTTWLHGLLLVVLMALTVVQPAAQPVAASSGASPQFFDTTGSSTKFVDVVTGDNHTCALRANGTVMCWGYNGEGQLGINDGSIRQSLYPVEVPGVSNAVAIAGAANNTCVITREATLTCWGQGYFGDGNGIYARWVPSTVAGMRDITKIAMSNRGTCVTNTYGMLMCWG